MWALRSPPWPQLSGTSWGLEPLGTRGEVPASGGDPRAWSLGWTTLPYRHHRSRAGEDGCSGWTQGTAPAPATHGTMDPHGRSTPPSFQIPKCTGSPNDLHPWFSRCCPRTSSTGLTGAPGNESGTAHPGPSVNTAGARRPRSHQPCGESDASRGLRTTGPRPPASEATARLRL